MSALLCNLLTVLIVQCGSQACGSGHWHMYHSNRSIIRNMETILTGKIVGMLPWSLGAVVAEDGFRGKWYLCGEAAHMKRD